MRPRSAADHQPSPRRPLWPMASIAKEQRAPSWSSTSGGGTFRRLGAGGGRWRIEVLSTSGDTHLRRAMTSTSCIVDHLACHLPKSNEGIGTCAETRQPCQRLHRGSREAKIELSSATQSEIQSAVHQRPRRGKPQASRFFTLTVGAKFEELASQADDRCRLVPAWRQALQDASSPPASIDESGDGGRSTRIPAVLELVKRITGKKARNQPLNPDESGGGGAAIQGGVAGR